jgi:hypothetical protein
LIQAVRAPDQAIEEGEIATWERFTARELMAVDDAGHLLTRAGHLTALRRAQLSWLTSQPLIYIDGIRVANVGSGTPSTCGQEYVAMLANGRVATRRCLKGTSWWLEVWEKSATGWQAVAVQGTAAAK